MRPRRPPIRPVSTSTRSLPLQLNELEQLRKIRGQLIERIKASHRLVDAYALQFDAGRRSLSDLANAHTDRFNAQSELLDNSVRQFNLGRHCLP